VDHERQRRAPVPTCSATLAHVRRGRNPSDRRAYAIELTGAGALAHLREQTAPAETGDTRADLVAQLRHFRDGIERPFGMAMFGTVLAEEHHNPELLAQFREHVVEPRRRMLRSVLEGARARGELAADADLESAVNSFIGSFYASYLAGAAVPRDWPRRVVELILDGVSV
jgi:Tetracyclin repressor-like, C-terminal domain